MRSGGHRFLTKGFVLTAGAALVVALPGLASAHGGFGQARPATAAAGATATPIKHLVVIFQENVSFDHYFGTYPVAANTSGQPFRGDHPSSPVDGLTAALLTHNPNGVNPRRLDPANLHDVLTCDQGHNYNAEQKAFDGGRMDMFPATVGNGTSKDPLGQQCSAGDVMNYYDGNTVTGLWNYAQNYSMSDNSFGTTFGPSAPGAVNLVSGDTGGVGITINGADTNGDTVPDGVGGKSMIEDPQPYYDDCSTRDAVSLTGANIGDELNAAGLSWGWFQGGFRPTTSFAVASGGTQPTSVLTPDEFKGKFASPPASDQGLCNAVHPVGAAVGGTGGTVPGGSNYGNKDDYIAHHEPFQYYASTANPHHLPVASLAAIGTDTQTVVNGQPQWNTANHQYDTSDFDSLVAAIAHGYVSPDHLPAVSFLKAPGYQDGHPAYSDPIDEQQFLVQEINALQNTPDWASTAVVVAYDDSDGWYDHVYSGVHNPSNTAGVATPPGPQDFLTGTGLCGTGTPLAGENGRCGFGPRLPLVVISPWARSNFVDHTLTNQTSITKFVEDNWGLPRISGSFDATAGTLLGLFDFRHGNHTPTLILDPITGQPVSRHS
jgi:phospholipase C